LDFFAKHFDACINHGSHLKELDLSSFKRILEVLLHMCRNEIPLMLVMLQIVKA
jgi:hypothetical protein